MDAAYPAAQLNCCRQAMGTPDDQPNLRGAFWVEVKQQVAAGLIMASVAGIGYIAWIVPRQLDQIYHQQLTLTEKAKILEGIVLKQSEQIDGLDRRVTRLEAE